MDFPKQGKMVKAYTDNNKVLLLYRRQEGYPLWEDEDGSGVYDTVVRWEYVTALSRLIEAFPDTNFLKADGFDDAVIGFDESTERLIYSVSKSIDILVNEGMSNDDAMEYFTFNVSGAYVGDKTPIWCYDIIA